MKNIEAQALLQDAAKLNGLSGFSFVLGIAKGKALLKQEQEVLEEMVKISKEFEEYQTEAREVNKKFSLKDENGDAKVKTINYKDGQQLQFFDLDPEKEDERKKEIAKLEKKHKALIEEQKEKEKKYQEALQEESTLKLQEISEKQFPKDITVEQMEIALKFFKIKE